MVLNSFKKAKLPLNIAGRIKYTRIPQDETENSKTDTSTSRVEKKYTRIPQDEAENGKTDTLTSRVEKSIPAYLRTRRRIAKLTPQHRG